MANAPVAGKATSTNARVTGSAGNGPGRVPAGFLLGLAALVMAACAPITLPGAPQDAVQAELRRTADIIFHRMELGFLEGGFYTTNVLIDVPLPEGARWTLHEFANDGSSYLLVLTSSRLPELAWRISPRGVARTNPPS